MPAVDAAQQPPLRATVNSFDLFDTLLVRRALVPARVFEDVERATGARGFAQARQLAEQSLIARNIDYDLAAIYREMVRLGQCDEASAAVLEQAEIEAEFDHALPITENLSRIGEHDLVVSDMYLPADILRRLLRHIGLQRHVHVIASNAGKHHGTIWPELERHWLIREHIGDNPHSDVAVPRARGIPAVHYGNSQPSQIEQLLAQHGQIELAGLARGLRLSCPHADASEEGQLWQFSVQLNLPLLCLTAAAVFHHARSRRLGPILFSARDCYQLADIFGILYPTVATEYVYVSRRALRHDPAGITEFLQSRGPAALVVDIASTGHSWYCLAEAQGLPVRLLALVRVDHHAYLQNASQEQIDASRYLDFDSLLRNSEFPGYSNAIEVLNTAPHGSATRLHSGQRFAAAEFDDTTELPPAVVATVDAAHRAAMALVRKSARRLREELPAQPDRTLLASLLQTITQSPRLREIGKVLL